MLKKRKLVMPLLPHLLLITKYWPTWNLKTEQKQDFFVNAIEGQVMELGEKENQVVDEHTGVRKNGVAF